jgi:diguanylate cyclase (GGDEF)-like protein
MAGELNSTPTPAPTSAAVSGAADHQGFPEKLSILLVEDEPTTRLMTSRQLTRAGYAVEAVSNGAEALAKLKQQYFPLMLTDWDMPEMNGPSLCRAVRELTLEGYVYTILLTAREGTSNIIEGLAAGADDYLTKPPDDNELRARLNTGRRILKLEQSLRAATQRNYLLSITDALTGCFNRRHLMERLTQELTQARRDGKSLAVILCDVDYFKKVNDTRGHQAGDAVLEGFAKLLMDSTRGSANWVARYGGEEFVIVVGDAGLTHAAAVAESLRAAIATHAFEAVDGSFNITASFGVAAYAPLPENHQITVDALIAQADLCLYRAKEGGRNRVVGYSAAMQGLVVPAGDRQAG